jgi:hypothetical protein
MFHPTLTTTLTGKQVTGPVQVAYIGDGQVSVTVDAHVNDKRPAVVFRGEDYLVHVFVVRMADGTLTTRDNTVTRRSNWSAAPQKTAAVIVNAVADHMRDIWDANLDHQATLAQANNARNDAEDKRAELAKQIRVLDEEIARLNAILD